MSTELFFIYDTHCPWSYATLPLVNEIKQAFPEITLHLWHAARYEGDENVTKQTIENVIDDSNCVFNQDYLAQLKQAKDSTLAANLMAWIEHKIPQEALPILNALYKAHFEQANELGSLEDVADIISHFKLSPPQKVFTQKKLTKDAEFIMHNIIEFQEIIETQAIPALLLAIDDNLIMLNHNLYLKNPKAIVDAIKLEQ
jgi:protein-disulfide isomerase-like protein with CxxC motif